MPSGKEGRLAGRSVAVIGASSGLGWAVAEAAAREGASLTVAARRAARLTTLQERSGGDVLAIACDVTVDGDCERVIDESIKRYGRLDALIYSAGVSPLGPVATTSSAEWAELFRVNVTGAAISIGAAAPHLRSANGRVVIMSSVSAHWVKPGLVPYSVSKRALEILIDGYREEEPGIAYTTIVIGSTGKTEFSAGWDPQVFEGYLELWKANNQLTKGQFASEASFCEIVMTILATDIAVPQITVQPLPSG